MVWGGKAGEGIGAGDVFVATVVRVADREATNGDPPRVWVKVHEVLRGDVKVVRSPAVWSPRFHGIDWVGGDSEALLQSWKAKPFPGPKVGEKFILGGRAIEPAQAGAAEAPVYWLFSFVYIPYSDAARAEVLAQLKAVDDAIRKRAAEAADVENRTRRGE